MIDLGASWIARRDRVKAILLWTFLSILSIADAADDVRINGFDVVAGIYTLEKTETVADATSVTGTRSQSRGGTIVKWTEYVPATKGTYFGISFKPRGEPEGASADVLLIIRFPERGITNPATGQTAHEYRRAARITVGKEDRNGYWFENDWEAVPGDWTFEIWYQDRKLAERVFHVYAP